jgi:predicted nucleic acid-binding protein
VIFLDANILLRYLAPADSEALRRMRSTARSLLLRLEAGEIEATTSEVVLHEICYVLTSPKQYGIPVEQAIAAIEPILRLRAIRFPPGDAEIYLRALQIWKRNPKLEFSDSVIAARCEANGWQLATFDRVLGSLPEVDRWQPNARE